MSSRSRDGTEHPLRPRIFLILRDKHPSKLGSIPNQIADALMRLKGTLEKPHRIEGGNRVQKIGSSPQNEYGVKKTSPR